MSTSALFIYIGFPVIFLTVATAHPRNFLIKGVCIVLAYFSLIFLDNVIYGSNAVFAFVSAPDGINDKSTSPFGLVFLGISLWGYTLAGYGLGKPTKKDNES
jgi:hypothetical protein